MDQPKLNLAIITAQKSDFSILLEQYSDGFYQYINPRNATDYDFSLYTAIAVLGGTEESPLVLDANVREKLEVCIETGVKVFCEYMMSIGDIYTAEPVSTRFSRLVYCGSEEKNLKKGDLLEEQCNAFLSPYFSCSKEVPWLIRSDSTVAHSHAEVPNEMIHNLSNRALWLESPNLMVCGFRMVNPVKARFSPFACWDTIFQKILEWLTGKKLDGFQLPRPYRVNEGKELEFSERARRGIKMAMGWFNKAKMLRGNGKKGIWEGFGTEVYPNGSQKLAKTVRTDCAGEASLAFLGDYLLTGNKVSLETSDNLESFCFDRMQIKEGPFRGMLRWTEIAWGVCYQDDAARAILPSLFKMMYLGERGRLMECCEALDFLQKTTGPDGLRPSRTDNLYLTPEEMAALAKEPAKFPSAHFNAFYLAALLLCGKMAGRDDFIRTGRRGLESIMAVYPETHREQSETEELCRLIMPLAVLYRTTAKEEHRDWLYRVVKDLQRFKHTSGAYLEWDTGYSAECSRRKNSECSMLTKNGDPVTDLLYSQNWLPMGFLSAWQITGDSWFYELWKENVTFFLDAQIYSEYHEINGAWARGFDVDRKEVYGVPNDVGWGPWAIESGWTVSEITAGIALGLCPQNPYNFL